GALGVARDLGAECAVRWRMIGMALHFHGAAVFDRHLHRAGIRAIVRTGGAHEGHSHSEMMAHDADAGVAESARRWADGRRCFAVEAARPRLCSPAPVAQTPAIALQPPSLPG